MSLQTRCRRYCLVVLVISMGALFLTQCATAALPAPPSAASAGLCEHRCPPPNMQTSTPVALPRLDPLLPWPQSHLRVVHKGDGHVVSRVSRGALLTRAPPHPRPHRVS